MAKYKVVQNGERIPSGDPIYQIADSDDVIVVADLMTKKEAEAALKALSPEKKAAPKKPAVKKSK